jgi:histidine phosphotransferase ChpT
MSETDLAALIGSRICHDLINPLGAIGNGIELLQLSSAGASPELALIAGSVDLASLRIRLFRMAFGAAHPGQAVSEEEIRALLKPGPDGWRIETDWVPQGDIPRPLVKVALLLFMCCESAMPRGGRVRIERTAQDWRMTADAAQLREMPELWRLIEGKAEGAQLLPAEVHFALAARELARLRRRARLTFTPGTISIEF